MRIIHVFIVLLSVSMLSLTSCKEAPKKEKKVAVEKVEKEEPTETAKEIEAKLAEQQAHEAQMKKAKEEASAKKVEADKKLKEAQAKKATQAKTKAAAKPELTKSAANKLKEAKQVATISGPAIETISPKDFYAKVKNGGVQLLDIRTQREFTANRIKGAKMFDIYKRTFIEDVINGGIDKNKPIYIYCLTASRSRSGRAKLSKAGYKKVYELKGGIKLWYQQGLPIEK